jgi:hypothetical protein
MEDKPWFIVQMPEQEGARMYVVVKQKEKRETIALVLMMRKNDEEEEVNLWLLCVWC